MTLTRPSPPVAHAGSVLAPPVRWVMGHAMPRAALAMSARQGDLHGQIVMTPGSSDLPLALFDQIRTDALHRSKFAYVTARQPVVREVLSSPDVSSGVDPTPSDGIGGRLGRWAWRNAPLGPVRPPSLLATEPPDHTRMRKLVTRVFSVRAVQQLRVRTEEIADELLSSLPSDRPIDLVDSYCALLPVTVIAEVLGVPTGQRDELLHFGSGAAPSLDLGLSWGRFQSVEQALAQFDTWLEEHIESKRAHPADDLLSQLVAARDEDGDTLSPSELKATAGLVLGAGFETTVNLLGNGVAALHAHPDQRELLAQQPEQWPNAVDEVLRLDPPVLLTGRTVVRDTEIAGIPLARGSVVTALLAAANRDPEVFVDPARFDVTRSNAADHVSFSAGRHYCLGASLARMEGEVGLRRLWERFPRMQVDVGSAERRSTRILRGYEHLPVRLGGY